MDLVQLRLYTYKEGKEVSALWSFTPLRNLVARNYKREDGDDGSGSPRRRAFNRQEVRQVTVPAGTLLNDIQFENFLRMFDAHKIEWKRSVGGKDHWIEYTLDADGTLEFERPDEIDRVVRHSFKLVQSDPVWYTDFENKELRFTDYGGR